MEHSARVPKLQLRVGILRVDTRRTMGAAKTMLGVREALDDRRLGRDYKVVVVVVLNVVSLADIDFSVPDAIYARSSL